MATPAPRLRTTYREQVVPTLISEFQYLNIMQVPKVQRVVVNIGIGEAIQNARALDAATSDLRQITGQQPVVVRARRSVAAFKLRAGMRMYEFLDKVISVVLPRIRDFRGVSPKLDGHGNFSLGLREQLVFPEIDYDKIDKIRGMEITVVTTARTDEEGRRLLSEMGMPFRRQER